MAGPSDQSAARPVFGLAAGAIWRWDGYTIRSGTPTQAAVRLQQRNRLKDLRARLSGAEQQAASARAARTEAEAAAQATAAAEHQARTARRDREQALERTRAAPLRAPQPSRDRRRAVDRRG